MSLTNNIVLEEDDNTTSHTFNKVDRPKGQAGTLRTNVDIARPESETLLITQGQQGKGVSLADRRSVTIDKTVVDVNGNLVRGFTTLTWVFPISTAFTEQMMIDITHKLFDLVVSTSSFDIDDDTVKSILRGES